MSAALLVKGVKIVAALGVTKVITDVIKVNTVAETMVQKVAVNIGGFVLGSMIMDKASEHVNAAIKAITENIEEAKAEAEDDESTEVEKKDEAP